MSSKPEPSCWQTPATKTQVSSKKRMKDNSGRDIGYGPLRACAVAPTSHRLGGLRTKARRTASDVASITQKAGPSTPPPTRAKRCMSRGVYALTHSAHERRGTEGTNENGSTVLVWDRCSSTRTPITLPIPIPIGALVQQCLCSGRKGNYSTQRSTVGWRGARGRGCTGPNFRAKCARRPMQPLKET